MEIRPRKPNPIGHILSEALRSMQQFGNKATIPYLDMGMGDLLMGDAQDAMERISYGEPLTTGTGQTTQLHPGTVDLGALASIPATMAKAPVQAGAKRLASSLRKPDIPVNPPSSMPKKTQDLLVQSQNRAIQERDFPTFQPKGRALDATDATSAGPPRPPRTKFQRLPEDTQSAIAQARMRALREGGAGGKPPATSVQVDPSRRDFLKKMGVGAGAAGAAVAAPKMLATAMKTGVPKAAATVAKGTAPAVAKGVFKSTGDIATKISMNMIDAFTNGLSYSKFADMTDVAKYLKKNQGVVDEVESALKKQYPKYKLDDFEEGFIQRQSGHVGELDKDLTGLVPFEKRGGLTPNAEQSAKVRRAGDMLDELTPTELEHWEVTGKWPKGKEDIMKWLDHQEYSEYSMDGMTGTSQVASPLEKLGNSFYDPNIIDL